MSLHDKNMNLKKNVKETTFVAILLKNKELRKRRKKKKNRNNMKS